MRDGVSLLGSEVGLTDTALLVYRWVLRGGTADLAGLVRAIGRPPADVRAAVEQLGEIGLLQPMSAAGRYQAVDPQAATREVLSHEESLRRRQWELVRRREAIEAFVPTYLATAGDDGSAREIQEIYEAELFGELAGRLVERCEIGVARVCPGGSNRPVGDERVLERDLGLLRLGRSLRVILQHSSRYSAEVGRYVRAVTAGGAEVRTVRTLMLPMLLVDGRFALVSRVERDEMAVMVRHETLAHALGDMFETVWQAGLPMSGADDQHLATASEEIDSTILDLLRAGHKDESIAKRLGISLRTCRRRVAGLLGALGAYSRFQGGYLARVRDEQARIERPMLPDLVGRPSGQ